MIVKVRNKYTLVYDNYFFFFHLKDKIKGNKYTSRCALIGDGFIKIPDGFVWNGANGVPDTDDMIVLSCIHDYLYDKHFYRAADELFLMLWNDRMVKSSHKSYLFIPRRNKHKCFNFIARCIFAVRHRLFNEDDM